MKKVTVLSEAQRHYAEAYRKHYSDKDLHAALQSYKEVVISYPDSKEAGYCRSQIQNIVQMVVPGDELYDARLEMALNYARRKDSLDRQPT